MTKNLFGNDVLFWEDREGASVMIALVQVV